jgi:pimeloyl-ACP methyl ester carboxylesterase
MRALAEAGYRAIAPDQRGFGDTDAPAAIEAYSIHHLVGDVVGLLDALAIEKAVIVGHDWGGLVAWGAAQLAHQRFSGVAGVNTPFFPRAPMSPLRLMRAVAQGNFNYVLYFQEPGVAEAELERDVRRTLRGFYQSPDRARLEEIIRSGAAAGGPAQGGLLDRLPDAPPGSYLTAADFEVFAGAFEKTGFRGGLNWYRNMERNWETTAYLSGSKVGQPALMITAELDPVLRPEMAAGMKEHVPNLRATVLVRDCGHWTQQEKPAEVNAALLDFLREFR